MKRFFFVILAALTAAQAGCRYRVAQEGSRSTLTANGNGPAIRAPLATRLYRGPYFKIAIPSEWIVASPQAAEPHDGSVLLRAERPDGGFVEIWECPETEYESDYEWHVESDASGNRVSRIKEERTCTIESKSRCLADAVEASDPEEARLYCGECSAGDGRLDIWASFNGERILPGGFCFHLGNSKREDADRDDLRHILMTFEVEREPAQK